MDTFYIEFQDIPLIVKGYHEQAEEEILYYGDLGGHPGSSASLDIRKVLVEDVDIYNLLSESVLDLITQQILEENG